MVMVGEIRDRETAEIAVQASLTGHLVLSTVHTNDAVGAITRMRDMKVEPFLLASTLRAVIAQRLVRRLCEHCRKAEPASEAVAALLGIEPGATIYEPAGCEQCSQTGFKGRIGVFEAVRVDETIRRLINEGGDEAAISRHAFANSPNFAAAARATRPRRTDHARGSRARVAQRHGRNARQWLISIISRSIPRGREKKGHIAAPSIDDARIALDRRRMYVVRIEEGSGAPPKSRGLLTLEIGGAKRMNGKALTLFTRQLATLNRVAPLEESLRTITRQTEQDAVRAVVENVHAGVVEGRRLSDAMAREPKSFPPLYRAMVAAGEGSGTLPTILDRLAVLLERQAEIRGKVITALAYPTVLAIVAVLVVSALMIFVVPQVVEQFDNVGQQLPFLTRAVMGVSWVMAHFWWLGLIVLAGIGFAFWRG